MSKVSFIDELWQDTPPADQILDSSRLSGLPDAARLYLEHAIAPGTRLATAVRLQMHGEIKLNRWFPFKAEQVSRWEQGMIWQATVRMLGVPIRGFDRLINGEAEMQWKLFGLFPFLTASGDDITRSAAGRFGAEIAWLPSALCREDVMWTAVPDSSRAQAGFMVEGERMKVEFSLDGGGRVESVKLKRWGKPEGAEYHYADFGGFAESEKTFDGYTIPTQLRVGWHFGTERFNPEGEFFRCTIDHAEFR